MNERQPEKDLRETMMRGKFLRTPQGQHASYAFELAYRKWHDETTEARREAERVATTVKAVLRQPPYRQRVPGPVGGPIFTLDPRRIRATRYQDAARMLSRPGAVMDRFHFRVTELFETGEVKDTTEIRGVAPDPTCNAQLVEQLNVWTVDQSYEAAKDNYELVERLAALATARDAQKKFKALNIPMNFVIAPGMIYLDLVGDYLTPVERKFCDQHVASAADRAGLLYRPQADVGNYQYGSLQNAKTPRWYEARYDVHLY